MAGEEKGRIEISEKAEVIGNEGFLTAKKRKEPFNIVDFILGLLGLRKRGRGIEVKPEAPEAKPAIKPAIKKPIRRKAKLKRKKAGKKPRGAKKKKAVKVKRGREKPKTGGIAKPAAKGKRIGKCPLLPEAIRVVYESAEKDESAIEEDISTTKNLLERIHNQVFM